MMENKTPYWFFGNRYTLLATLVLAFALGIGIRLFDLTDLPLDFASTRQMFSVLKARSMYYAMLPESAGIPAWQREMAARQTPQVIEPPVIEALTALTYRLTGEHIWIARIYSSLFWVLAGILLFLLAREIASPQAALVSLLFYLFLPFGVLASRSFQPDPLMVALIVAAAWGLYRWYSEARWKWAVSAGLLMGVAIFVKNVAVFPLSFAALAIVLDQLRERGWQATLKNRQIWTVALLSLLPVIIYTLYGVANGFLVDQVGLRFFPELWTSGQFYLRWLGQIDGIVGFGGCVMAVAGVFVAGRRPTVFLAGLWIGYVVFGMTFDYHVITHDYYNLMLIPLVSLSLAPVTELLFQRAADLRVGWLARAIFAVLAISVVAVQIWNVRVQLVQEDWRPDEQFWTMLGQKLGRNSGTVLAITQDYGYRLEYWGWQDVESWYDTGDLDLRKLDNRTIDTSQVLLEKLKDKQFFVVTQMKNFDDQPEVKAYLYAHYPIYAQGRGYIIFDLRHPTAP